MPSTFARIGRSYPRVQSAPAPAVHAPAGRRLNLRITSGVVALVSAVAVAWLLLR